jgi:hypothetical protein
MLLPCSGQRLLDCGLVGYGTVYYYSFGEHADAMFRARLGL